MSKIKMGFLAKIVLVLGILLGGCAENITEKVIESYEDGLPKTIKYIKNENDNPTLVKEVQFYPNGEKRYEGAFEDNKKHGKWTFWFDEGGVWSEGYFDKGLRTGPAKVFHNNGNPYYVGEYKDGKKHGEWNFYNVDGKLINEITFDNGKFVKQSAEADFPELEQENNK